MLREWVEKNRSCRSFDSSVVIGRQTLKEWVDLTRFCSSARNAQPLKYFISSDPESNAGIFSCLHWASYLQPGGIFIPENERPSAYIVMCADSAISSSASMDAGIAAQTILLAAVESGFGGCMIGAIEKKVLKERLFISDAYDVLLVIALGKPVEKVVIEPLPESGDIRYYRDENHVHHVPKRSLEEILLNP